MQNVSVYLNHRASNGSGNWQKKINKALFRSHVEYKHPKDLDELYVKLNIDVQNEIDVLVVVGGDGTVNTVIQRLAGTNVGLLVIPGGTANDFARSLGTGSDTTSIAQTIRQNIRKKIDLISINGKFMATNGGLGFATEVANEINQLRKAYPFLNKIAKLFGEKIYSFFLAKKLLSKEIKNYKFTIQSDEYSETFISSLILINNQPVFGGTFEIAPKTDHQDGTFNITIFKHQNRLDLVGCILKMLNGYSVDSDKNVVSFESSEVKIDLLDNKKIAFFGDGEIFGRDTSWKIKCHPQSLSVFSPQDQEDAVSLGLEASLM